MMTRFTLLTLLALGSACVVKDLELDTDGESSSGDGGAPPLAEETAASEPAPTQVDDPDAWAAMMATRRCDAFERCGCFGEAWSWFDPQACFEDNYEFYWQRAEWAQVQGAELNPVCLRAHEDALFDGACGDTVPPISGLGIYDAVACKMFVGAGEVGDVCAGRGDLVSKDDTCREGLECFAGACVPLAAEGGPCGDAGSCALPHLCIGGVCTTPGRVGDPCSDGTCEVGLICGESGCRAAGSPGEACEYGFECASLRCVNAQCEPPAAALCGPYAWEVPG